MQSLGSVQKIGSHTSQLCKTSTSNHKQSRRYSTLVTAKADNKNSDTKQPQGTTIQNLFSAFAPSNGNGTQNIFAGLGTLTKSSPRGRTDPNTVFVAGASGRLGLRIVRELAEAGFKVRAGVRSEEKAEIYQDLLADLAETVGPLDRAASNRIQLVYCNLDEPESITPAIGNASRVVCAVGAAESEFTDLSAPRRIDYEGTERLINAAASLDTIGQFVLVTSLGTGKLGFPAGVLNLFGGVLVFKRKAEEALERSGMPYLIVRPGGMERPKDDHKLTHNVRLATRDTLFGGTVSRLQVAELITAAIASPELVQNKTVEVVAETKAPLREYEVLLNEMPVEIDQEGRVAVLQVERELRGELDVALEELEVAKERLDAVREQIAELQSETASARATAKDVQKEQTTVVKEAEKTEKELIRLRDAAEKATLLASAAKAIATESQRAQREARVLTRQEITAIRENILNPPPPAPTTTTTTKKATTTVGSKKGRQSANDAAPAAEQEKKEEKKEALPFASLFGAVTGTMIKKVQEEEEEEVVEEEESVPEEKKEALPFASLFGAITKKVQEEEEEEEEEVVVEEEESAPEEKKDAVIGMFADFLGGAARKATPPVVEKKVVPVEEKKEAPVQQQQQQDAANDNVFAGITKFFQPQPAVFIDEIEKEEEKAREAAKEQFEKEKAARAQQKQQEQQAAAAAAAAAAEQAAKEQEEEKKRKEQEEQEKAAAAAALAAEQAAKAQAAAEQASKAATEALSNAFSSIKLPWQQEEQQPESSSSTPASSSTPPPPPPPPSSSSSEQDNVKEAREWIANWKARSQSSSAPAETSSSPETTTTTTTDDNDVVPQNVQEAREWIANWKSKSN